MVDFLYLMVMLVDYKKEKKTILLCDFSLVFIE